MLLLSKNDGFMSKKTHNTQHKTTQRIPQHTTHNTQHATRNTQHTIHNTQHTSHNIQYNATHSSQYTTHNTQHTTHNAQHTAHNAQYTAHNTQHTNTLTQCLTHPYARNTHHTTTQHTFSQVVVCNVMTSGAGVNRRAGLAKRLNRQLALYAKGTASPEARKKRMEEGGGMGADPVQFVKLNNPRASRDDGRAFDGLHLNARGYRAFAGALYDTLGPMMVSVEWGFWKARLARGLTVGADGSGSGGGAVVAPVSGGGVEPKSKQGKKAD